MATAIKEPTLMRTRAKDRCTFFQLLMVCSALWWSGCPGNAVDLLPKNKADSEVEPDGDQNYYSGKQDSATSIYRSRDGGMGDTKYIAADFQRDGDGAVIKDGALKYDKQPILDKKIIADKKPTKTDLGCSANQEILDGKDNNCNGLTDEGFWAVGFEAPYAELTQYQGGCSSANAFSDYCNSGANRYCQARGYKGGFGPVEYGPESGMIVCLADAYYLEVTYASLTAQHDYCPSLGAFSVQCNSAIHRLCSQWGYVSGVGPVEHIGNQTADIICTRHAQGYEVSFNTLAQYHEECTGTQNAFSPPCQAAINRFCQAHGHVTGFGVVEYNVDAYVICLNQQ
jgi:hypothetical protein